MKWCWCGPICSDWGVEEGMKTARVDRSLKVVDYERNGRW